jgi:hypothetical protein
MVNLPPSANLVFTFRRRFIWSTRMADRSYFPSLLIIITVNITRVRLARVRSRVKVGCETCSLALSQLRG